MQRPASPSISRPIVFILQFVNSGLLWRFAYFSTTLGPASFRYSQSLIFGPTLAFLCAIVGITTFRCIWILVLGALFVRHFCRVQILIWKLVEILAENGLVTVDKWIRTVLEIYFKEFLTQY